MKKKVLLIICMIVLSPLTVNANIRCNDGTISKSCADCHRGCCSRHGGCTNNSYSKPKNTTKRRKTSTTKTTSSSKTNVKATNKKTSTVNKNVSESNKSNVVTSTEKPGNIKNSENQRATEKNSLDIKSKSEETNDESMSFSDGIISVGVLGAIAYGLKKGLESKK